MNESDHAPRSIILGALEDASIKREWTLGRLQVIEAEIVEAAHRAQKEHFSWTAIGHALGMNPERARRRYGRTQ